MSGILPLNCDNLFLIKTSFVKTIFQLTHISLSLQKVENASQKYSKENFGTLSLLKISSTLMTLEAFAQMCS